MSKKDQVIKDAELYVRMKDHLYSKKPVLGEGSPFSELLQSMVNTVVTFPKTRTVNNFVNLTVKA